MLLQKILKRRTIALSHEDSLYSHSALSVTVEFKDLLESGSRWHITMTKQDLEKYLAKITDRENEIKVTTKGK